MGADDVPACERVWRETYGEMRARFALPAIAVDDEEVRRMQRRLAYLLTTDPDSSWVGELDGEVVGLAQALCRDGLWVLSLFGVHPRAQRLGLARLLLEKARASMDTRGLIVSSRDPRAIGTYGRAGFRLHPSVTARGRVRRPADWPASVSEGTVEDYGVVEAVDRAVRGAARSRADIEHLLGEGLRLLLAEDRGYSLVNGVGRPMLVAATDEAAARDLVRAAFSTAGPDGDVELSWITAPNHWAIEEALAAGLDLLPVGPVCVAGMDAPAPYLANGMLG